MKRMLALTTRSGCLEGQRQEMGADHTTTHVFDKRVARDYEAWYEQGFGRFASRLEEALLHLLLQRFPGASSLLEVGCGTGHFTRWFAKQGFQVTGLDASPAMLEQAPLRNGTTYLLGDAQARVLSGAAGCQEV